MGISRDFITTMQGSALPRASLSSSVAVGIYLYLYYNIPRDQLVDFGYLSHPYTVGFLASVTCFAIIFRSQSAIARYYEAARETHTMQSKIADAVAKPNIVVVVRGQSLLAHILLNVSAVEF